MHSVILQVEKPTYGTAEEINWHPFLEAASVTARRSTGIRALGESCWLIALHSDLDSFVSVAHAAQAHKFRYQALFLEGEPEWIRSSAPTS